MTDEQPPITPEEQPPPPEHGPFAAPPSWGPPPNSPQAGWNTPRGFYPLTIGRVFELTWSIYRFHFRTMLALGLLTMIPLAALAAMAQYYQVSSPDFVTQMSSVSSGGTFDDFKLVTANLPLSLAYGLLAGIISVIGNGAFADAAARTISGNTVNAAQALRHSIGKIVTWVGIYLVIFTVETGLLIAGFAAGGAMFGPAGLTPGINAFVGILVFVALGVTIAFLTIRWQFTGQTVMVESAGSLTTLRRSWHLVAGSGWRVVGYVLGFGLLVGLFAAVFGVVAILGVNPFQITTEQPDAITGITIDAGRVALATFISSALSSIVVPIPTIALTLLYFDLRFRKGEQVPQPR